MRTIPIQLTKEQNRTLPQVEPIPANPNKKTLSEIERAKREKLKREKPEAFEKIMKIGERYDQGIATPIIDLAYSYVCNLSCDHCTAWRGRWMRPRARASSPPRTCGASATKRTHWDGVNSAFPAENRRFSRIWMM